MTMHAIATEGDRAPPSPSSHTAIKPLVPIYLPSPSPAYSSLPISFHPQLHFSSPPLSPSASVRVLVCTILLALSSIPICLTLNSASSVSSHPLSLFLVSVLILCTLLALLLALLYSSLHSHPSSSSSPSSFSSPSSSSPSPPLFLSVFCLFTFSSFIDFLLALTAYSLHPLTSFYLEHGEPYLSSPHGAAINLFDGTAHLTLYLAFIHAITRGTPYHTASIVWCGSILNSLVTLLLGAVVGYGGALQWSMLLNTPYVVLPLLMASRRWQQRHVLLLREEVDGEEGERRGVGNAAEVTLATSAVAIGVVALTVGVHALRVSAALSTLVAGQGGIKGGGMSLSSPLLAWWATEVEPTLLSPSSFPLVQHLLLAFTSTPLLLLLLPSLLPFHPPPPPPSPGLVYFALVHAGAIMQGHSTYLMQVLMPHTTGSVRWMEEGEEGERWEMGWRGGMALVSVEMAVVVGNLWLAWRIMGLAQCRASHSTAAIAAAADKSE